MDEQVQPEPKMVVEHDGARVELPLPDPSANTILYVDSTIKAMRSEMRVWFISAIVGNQLIAHVALQSALGYVGGGAIVAVALGAKLLSSVR